MNDIALIIYETLNQVVEFNGRIYEGVFPQPSGLPPAWPAVRFSFLGNTAYPTNCGDSDFDADDVAVQIDIVTDALQGTAALSALREKVLIVMADLLNSEIPTTRELDFYDFDAETKTHRRIIRYVLSPSSTL